MGIFTATVTCQSCKINCKHASCFRVTSKDGYDNQFCGVENCTYNNKIVQTFTSCNFDLYGKICSTGVCVKLLTIGCASSYPLYLNKC